MFQSYQRTRSAVFRSLLLAAVLLGGSAVLLVGAWRTPAAARTVTAPRPAVAPPMSEVVLAVPEPAVELAVELAVPQPLEEAASTVAPVPRQALAPPQASRRDVPALTIRSLDPREVPAPVRERLRARLAERR